MLGQHFATAFRKTFHFTTNNEKPLSKVGGPRSLLDTAYVSEQALYFAHHGLKRLMRTEFFGSVIVPIPKAQEPRLALFDGPEQRVYWQENNEIYCSNVDGQKRQVLVSRLHEQSHPVVDLSGKRIYWANWLHQEILSIDVDGSHIAARETNRLAMKIGERFFAPSDSLQNANVLGTFRLPAFRP